MSWSRGLVDTAVVTQSGTVSRRFTKATSSACEKFDGSSWRSGVPGEKRSESYRGPGAPGWAGGTCWPPRPAAAPTGSKWSPTGSPTTSPSSRVITVPETKGMVMMVAAETTTAGSAMKMRATRATEAVWWCRRVSPCSSVGTRGERSHCRCAAAVGGRAIPLPFSLCQSVFVHHPHGGHAHTEDKLWYCVVHH